MKMDGFIVTNWTWKPICIMIVICLVFISCYPDNAFDIEEFDTAITFYDESIDFSSFSTYALPDSVVEIGERNLALTGQFDSDILSRIRSNMAELGYTEVDQGADVILLVSKTSSTNVDAYTFFPIWWDYWGWYPAWPGYGGIGPGWYPYYPWAGTVVFSYTTGTVFIDMLDPGKISGEQIPSVWSGAINGLIEGNNTQIERRIEAQIDQLFEQSPYLQQ